MATSTKSKKSARQQRLVRRLAAYSMAAGAAIAAGDQAQGAIVHTDVNTALNAGQSYSFGIDGAEFTINVQSISPSHGSWGSWGAKVSIFKNGDFYSWDAIDNNNVPVGNTISETTGGQWQGNQTLAYRKFYWSSTSSGVQVRADDNRLPTGNSDVLPLRFQDEGTGDLRLGWIRLSIAKNPTSNPTGFNGAASFTVSIQDWAYESTVGGSIVAGDTGGGSQVPEPGTLGMLAVGALGMLAWKSWRKREAETAA